MYNIVVVEATEDMDDGVGFADIAKELVAKSFTLGGSFYKTCNVNDLNCRRNDFGSVDHRGKDCQTFIGYGDDTHIGFYGAKREVSALGFGVAQAIEEGRLSHVGQTHNAAFKTHSIISLVCLCIYTCGKIK